MEKWRQHQEFLDHEISDLGRVRRYLTPFLMSNGYPHVSLGGVKKRRYLHNLVLEAFVGPRPKGQHTRHLDGDKKNNVLNNLQYGTVSENMADRVRHGGGNRGSRHGLSKIIEHDVLEIRRRVNAGDSRVVIAKDFRISRRLVGLIAEKKRWGHVADKWPFAPPAQHEQTSREHLHERERELASRKRSA